MKTKVVLKQNQDLKLTIGNHPQLIALYGNHKGVELEITQFPSDYNIVFERNGLICSLWCDSYQIVERGSNE